MSTDKNFSTADNNDPQPPVKKQSASGNNPVNARQEPKYTQLYGLEGADGKMSLNPRRPQSLRGLRERKSPISTHQNSLI